MHVSLNMNHIEAHYLPRDFVFHFICNIIGLRRKAQIFIQVRQTSKCGSNDIIDYRKKYFKKCVADDINNMRFWNIIEGLTLPYIGGTTHNIYIYIYIYVCVCVCVCV